MPSTAAYFEEATALDLFELRAADIALRRGGARAQAFAAESRRRHQAISAQFSFAGRYLDMLPSRTLPRDYQQKLEHLLTAGQFDQAYFDQQRAVLGRGLELHSRFARGGASPTLRPVARFAAQSIASEQRLLSND